MSQTFIAIISTVLVAVLLFIVPVMATANQNDKITETAIQTIVSEFTDTVAKEGKITQENYNNLVQKLNATGNTYEVSLEVQRIDGNPLKSDRQLGENVYHSIFTDEILQNINNNSTLVLDQGDYVIAKVENTNVTMGTTLKNFVYSIMGADTIAIDVSSSALVSGK